MNYKLTSKTKLNFLGKTLFQIEAVIDFKSIKKGEKGGWIEKESNLSGNAWVSGNAEVYGNAEVSGNRSEERRGGEEGRCGGEPDH